MWSGMIIQFGFEMRTFIHHSSLLWLIGEAREPPCWQLLSTAVGITGLQSPHRLNARRITFWIRMPG